ncbi:MULTISPECIES: hypothetical protein [unclassified Luteococcus]|uniref:hypothetical protein n=1 Tax=unclassified Luteococcus TaxID=2639923 RepID=UPI00313A8F09
MKPRQFALLTLVVLAASACGGQDQPAPSPAATPTTTAPVPSAEQTNAGTETQPSTNADGYMVKKLGDAGGMTTSEGKEIVTFTVHKIVKDIKCTTDYAEKPANGHYVGIYMDVETTPALLKQDVNYFTTNQWSVVGPDGIEENSTSGNAYSCLNEAETLPVQLDKATHRKGWVVIDVKNTNGRLRLTQDTFEGGWEYSL